MWDVEAMNYFSNGFKRILLWCIIIPVHMDKSYQMNKKIHTIQTKKMHFSEINILFFLFYFMMSSTCFEPEALSLGRRLYLQIWYSVFTCIRISSIVGTRVCVIGITKKLGLSELFLRINRPLEG